MLFELAAARGEMAATRKRALIVKRPNHRLSDGKQRRNRRGGEQTGDPVQMDDFRGLDSRVLAKVGPRIAAGEVGVRDRGAPAADAVPLNHFCRVRGADSHSRERFDSGLVRIAVCGIHEHPRALPKREQSAMQTQR